jgi:hypothetical protein
VNIGIQFKIKDSWIFDYLKKILNNKTHDPYLRARCVAAIEQFGIEKKEIAKLLIEASINESSLIVLQEIALSLDKMGNRNDAIDILSKVYLPIHNKASNRAREIYDSIWELTSVE